MKVLALILALIGVGGASAAAAPSTPSYVPPQTVTAAPVAARETFDRPPRMTHTVIVVKPAAAPVKAAKPVVKKKHTTTVKKKHKTVTTARVRANLDRGILPSAYTGPYYDARYESFRRCVVKRESEGRYGARNHDSGAAGAYQFMPSWTRTIQKWTGEHKPIYAMSRYAQDLAFWRAFNHGKGAHNWAGGRWHC